jgi:diguanylate cyclase (GGDEF)-like protein
MSGSEFLKREVLHFLLEQRFTYALLSLDLKIEAAAENFPTFLGRAFTLHQPVTELFEAFIGAEDALQALYNGTLPSYRLEYLHCSASPHDRYFTLHLYPLHQNANGYLLLIEDVTEVALLEQKAVQARNELALLRLQLEQTQAELARQARFDTLTNLLNRRAFDEALEKGLLTARAQSAPLSVLFLDLDNLKEINDTHGHPAGDLALQRVAEVLIQSIRATDVAARYGGDEFVILLANTTEEQADHLARRLQENLRQQAEGLLAPIEMSGGIASLSPLVRTAQDLIQQADIALYHAKRRGKNQIVKYSSLQQGQQE